tara:strand:- start:1 stop:261 length:261 start_codon:yes stop_codon:yes gene_type:complete
MYINIKHNNSGDTLSNRLLAPNEILDIEKLVSKEIKKIYGDELKLNYCENIPSGCADYYAQIRVRKNDSLHVWTSADFFAEQEQIQ